MNELELQMQKELKRTEQFDKLSCFLSWGNSQGEELQTQKQSFKTEVMTFQSDYDEAVINEMQSKLPYAQIDEIAQVPEPPVQYPGAKKGQKYERERKKKIMAAQKLNQAGDEYTLDILSGLDHYAKCKGTPLPDELQLQCEKSSSDLRILTCYSQDYNLNKHGQPLKAADNEILMQNRSFMSDYVSDDPELRKPHLDRITNELINTSLSLTPNMFDPELFAKNAAHYRHIGDIFVYLENLRKDNKDYFSNLPQFQKDVLSSMDNVYTLFVAAFGSFLNARGIKINSGNVYTGIEAKLMIELGTNSFPIHSKLYRERLENSKIDVANAFSREVERQTEKKKEAFILSDTESTQLYNEKFKFSLPAGASEQQYIDIKKYSDMIADHPSEYTANKEIIDHIFYDYFKTISTLNENLLSLRAREAVIEDNKDPESTDLTKKALMQAADNMQLAEAKESNLLLRNADHLTNIMAHLLLNVTLSSGATNLLMKYISTTPTVSPNNPSAVNIPNIPSAVNIPFVPSALNFPTGPKNKE